MYRRRSRRRRPAGLVAAALLCGAALLAFAPAGGAAPAPGAPAGGAAPASAAPAPAVPAGGVPAPAAPAGAPLDPAAYQKEIEAWRADRVASLKRPDGWFSYVGRFRLEEGESRVGSDPAAAVVLPAGRAPAFAGTLVRKGDAVTFVPAPGRRLPWSAERHAPGEHGLLQPAPPGPAFKGPLVLADDSTEAGPTVVHLGAVSFYIIKRFDVTIVRVNDAEAPAVAAFKGLDDFPVRPDWRVVARFETTNPPQTVRITTVVGETTDAPAAGTAVFERDGKTYRLDAFPGTGGRLFIVFGDQTNGFETYGAGRFLDTDEAPQDGRVVLDFNKAYNPPCAISFFAVCPLPPPGNRLPLRVLAGEKTFRAGHHG